MSSSAHHTPFQTLVKNTLETIHSKEHFDSSSIFQQICVSLYDSCQNDRERLLLIEKLIAQFSTQYSTSRDAVSHAVGVFLTVNPRQTENVLSMIDQRASFEYGSVLPVFGEVIDNNLAPSYKHTKQNRLKNYIASVQNMCCYHPIDEFDGHIVHIKHVAESNIPCALMYQKNMKLTAMACLSQELNGQTLFGEHGAQATVLESCTELGYSETMPLFQEYKDILDIDWYYSYFNDPRPDHLTHIGNKITLAI